MKQTRLIKKTARDSSSLRFISLLLVLFVIFLVLQNSIINVNAEDEDEDDEDDDDFEDVSKDLGWAAIGLFVVNSIYVLFSKAFRITRKFSDEGKFAAVKSNTRSAYLKVRKPLQIVHGVSGLGALVVLLIHGIVLTDGDSEAVALGWATTAIFIFYILTGIILMLKLKPFWTAKKVRKTLLFLHRNLILLALIFILHIVHIVISD